MNQLIHWLSMGKYTAYVWPCYGLMMTVFLFHYLGMKCQKRRVHQQLKAWFER